jgi:5,8-dihydroxy-2-naphthoate synthase
MREILIGCTPDPDDAFAWHALATRIVSPPPGVQLEVRFAPIAELNDRIAEGALDIAAISSVLYPRIARSYAILRPGASVGRGYGPRLAARSRMDLAALAGKRVGVPGTTSTGTALCRLFAPRAITVPLPFEEIAPRVASGELEAGVLIHEDLMSYGDHQLVSVACLGDLWTRRTGLPLPVGLNVIRRSLGERLCAELARCVSDSVLHALAHRREASEWAMRFSRAQRPGIAERFIRMFANGDTVSMPPDCVSALARLYGELRDAGLSGPDDTGDDTAPLDLVEPAPAAAGHVLERTGLGTAESRR